MSTRSIIVVTGKGTYHPQTVRLYKHSDGYPTGNLPIIRDAIQAGLKLMKDDAEEFSEAQKPFNSSTMTGLLIGSATSNYGMGSCIEETYEEPFSESLLGDHWDLEWIYVIDTDKQSLGIYGGGYTGKGPQDAYNKGFVNPISYADNLIDSYQDGERKEIRQFVKEILDLGFSVNDQKSNVVTLLPAPKAKLKPVEQTTEQKIEAWLRVAKKSVEANSQTKWPKTRLNWQTIVWTKGKKYFKIFVNDSETQGETRSSAYMFIDFEGQIFKAASYKTPAKGVRADISKLDPKCLDGSTAFLYRR